MGYNYGDRKQLQFREVLEQRPQSYGGRPMVRPEQKIQKLPVGGHGKRRNTETQS